MQKFPLDPNKTIGPIKIALWDKVHFTAFAQKWKGFHFRFRGIRIFHGVYIGVFDARRKDTYPRDN